MRGRNGYNVKYKKDMIENGKKEKKSHKNNKRKTSE